MRTWSKGAEILLELIGAILVRTSLYCWISYFEPRNPGIGYLLIGNTFGQKQVFSNRQYRNRQLIFWRFWDEIVMDHAQCEKTSKTSYIFDKPFLHWNLRKFNQNLEKNSIQPVFSTSPTQQKVKTAFKMLIQGYFHEFQVKIAYRKCTKFWTFFHTVERLQSKQIKSLRAECQMMSMNSFNHYEVAKTVIKYEN